MNEQERKAIAERAEKRLQRLRRQMDDSDMLWANRWAQGTAALRYPQDGDNRPVEENTNQG